jgi:release factor glutamine methyltransferase
LELREARKLASTRLAEAGIERPWFEADLLICHILRIERVTLLAHPERIFPGDHIPGLMDALERRAAREPLQYITGHCEFMGHLFRVGPGCLVPRSETELLVLESRKHFRGGVFLDWGTGSGCIAVSILLDNPRSRSVAVDSSPRALSWAWGNLKESGLLRRCLLCHSPSFERIPVPTAGFEMIISNPPYIPTEVIPELMPEVGRYEPTSALDGGKSGFDHYRTLVEWAPAVLAPGGALILEMGTDEQAERLISIIQKPMIFESITRDLQGNARVIVLKRSPF